MDNPWIKYDWQAENSVHKADLATVTNFNKRTLGKKRDGEYALSTSNVALPYFGNPGANVVLLYLNPGLDPSQTSSEESEDCRFLFDKARKHELVDPHPFVFLHPAFEGTPGYRWWQRTLGPLLTRFSGFPERVLNNLFSVELHPYKSVKYSPILERDGTLESTEYTYQLVREAIKRGVLVLLARGARDWIKAVPELEDYPYVMGLSSAQNSVISPNNVIFRNNPNATTPEDQKNLAWQMLTKVALAKSPGDTSLKEELAWYAQEWKLGA